MIERDRPIVVAIIQFEEDGGSRKLVGNLLHGPGVIVGSLDVSVEILRIEADSKSPG